MRIALVSFEYPPFHGGGIGTYAGIMSRHLARAGHEVHVIANGFNGEYGDDPAEGVEGLTVHRLHALDRDYRPIAPHDRPDDALGAVCRRFEKALYWSVLVADELARLHRDRGLEVVEFPECFAEGATALRRRAAGLGFENLAMVVHLHTPIRDHTELNLGRTWEPWFRRRVELEEYGIRAADRLSSPSRSLAGIVADRLRLDPGRHPCDVIPYAMDFDEAQPDLEVPPSGNPSLLFVGRLEPRKGVVELVDAAVRVMADHPTLTVHLLGRDCAAGVAEGSMAEHLRRRIPAELLPRFVFDGLRPRAEVLGRYRTASACVFAAPWDNYPFTCCEAMASGAAVVVSDAGGMAELVEHELSGLVFRSRDVDHLAAAIRRLLTEPELCTVLRRGAVERVRTVCDPETVVNQRLEHYRRAVDSVHRRPRSLDFGAA